MPATSVPVLTPVVLAACSTGRSDAAVTVGPSASRGVDVVVSCSRVRSEVVLREGADREVRGALADVVGDCRRTEAGGLDVGLGAAGADAVDAVLAEPSPSPSPSPSTVVVVLSTVVVPRMVAVVRSRSRPVLDRSVLDVVDEDGSDGAGAWAS